MRKSKAFTLIELLVVIAIIAILAAILFPVFAQAKAAAKKAAAISNHKQLSLAVIQYTADYDDRYPLTSVTVTYSVASNPPDATWGYLSYPYMKNQDIFADPMDGAQVTERDTDGTPVPSGSVPAQYKTEQLRYNLSLKADYGVNTQFFNPWGYLCPNYFQPFSIATTQPNDPPTPFMASARSGTARRPERRMAVVTGRSTHPAFTAPLLSTSGRSLRDALVTGGLAAGILVRRTLGTCTAAFGRGTRTPRSPSFPGLTAT